MTNNTDKTTSKASAPAEVAQDIARKAKLNVELMALAEREHEAGFFDMPINAG